jgi:hypothetical protein
MGRMHVVDRSSITAQTFPVHDPQYRRRLRGAGGVTVNVSNVTIASPPPPAYWPAWAIAMRVDGGSETLPIPIRVR